MAAHVLSIMVWCDVTSWQSRSTLRHLRHVSSCVLYRVTTNCHTLNMMMDRADIYSDILCAVEDILVLVLLQSWCEEGGGGVRTGCWWRWSTGCGLYKVKLPSEWSVEWSKHFPPPHTHTPTPSHGKWNGPHYVGHSHLESQWGQAPLCQMDHWSSCMWCQWGLSIGVLVCPHSPPLL